jgi:hypothetical protein
MSENKITNQQMPAQPMNDHGSFEREDLSPSGVIYFMIGLGVVVAVLILIVLGMYHFLNSYQEAHQPALSPLVTAPADTRAVAPQDTQSFPQPRLEESERAQLRQFIEDQDRKLATYDWVDKDKGIVQIPIDHAMDLIVERGLQIRPENVRSEGSTAAPASSAPLTKQSPKAPARKPAASGN